MGFDHLRREIKSRIFKYLLVRLAAKAKFECFYHLWRSCAGVLLGSDLSHEKSPPEERPTVNLSTAVLKRKFQTFKSDPVGSTRAKALSLILAAMRRWGRKRLREARALSDLEEFVSSRPPHSFPPNFADLWFLYRNVRKRRPRTVLEFGSGCSTVIIAKALFDNQRDGGGYAGRLYSLDADPYWAESTRNSIPSFLRDLCEILYSPTVETEYDGIPALRHSRLPDIEPDFIYLDGPPLTPQRQVAVDVLDMEPRFPSDFFLVIDGRRENARFLSKYLKRRYVVRKRRFLDNTTFTLDASRDPLALSQRIKSAEASPSEVWGSPSTGH